MTTLSYETLVLDGTPRAGDQRLPSGEAIVWEEVLNLLFGQTSSLRRNLPNLDTPEQTLGIVTVLGGI